MMRYIVAAVAGALTLGAGSAIAATVPPDVDAAIAEAEAIFVDAAAEALGEEPTSVTCVLAEDDFARCTAVNASGDVHVSASVSFGLEGHPVGHDVVIDVAHEQYVVPAIEALAANADLYPPDRWVWVAVLVAANCEQWDSTTATVVTALESSGYPDFMRMHELACPDVVA